MGGRRRDPCANVDFVSREPIRSAIAADRLERLTQVFAIPPGSSVRLALFILDGGAGRIVSHTGAKEVDHVGFALDRRDFDGEPFDSDFDSTEIDSTSGVEPASFQSGDQRLSR